MALIHWEPLETLSSLRQQVDCLVEDLRQRYSTSTHFIHNIGLGWQPAMEIQETDAEIILKVEMPGIAAKDLDVRVSQNAVSILGEHHREELTEHPGFCQSEFHYGQFQRQIPLPKAVRSEQVQAKLKDGVLILMLPKVEEPHSQVARVDLEATDAALDSTTQQPREQKTPSGKQPSHSYEGKGGQTKEHPARNLREEMAHQQGKPKTSLEEYCDDHPETAACRIYDD
jgi:HSP20 family protein